MSKGQTEIKKLWCCSWKVIEEGGKNQMNQIKEEMEKIQKRDKIKFLKHAIKFGNKKARVWYSKGELYGFPKGTVTIYARDYGSQLPDELSPQNQTDMMTDYFEKDRARIKPDSKYYKKLMKSLKKYGI